ncbi:Fe-S cluster assembly protein SufD [Colwellia psychrerythraea]|uniref:Fe-S cluster assembly protein SufD n=1 Tax=Colwellia psychrerythraea TaxID=28229 RepID=A0A1Y5E1G5_COLPS|nr:Fe-S cluster assembly protein SufD [Colwellia psychrerythraea]
MNAGERLLKDYSQNKARLAGHSMPWLTGIRECARESFAVQGLPEVSDEDWKYTKLTQLAQANYGFAERLDSTFIASLADNVLNKLIFAAEHRLVFVNGHYNESLSTINLLPEGVILTSLAQAIEEHAELLSSTLGSIADYATHPFTALNTAMLSDGVFLLAQKNTKIETPIHCLFISTATEQSVVNYPRLLLLLDESAELTLVEHYLDMAQLKSGMAQTLSDHNFINHNLTNCVTEVLLSPHAHMDHYKLQYDSTDTSHIAAMYVEQQRASTFTSHSYSVGAALARNDIQIKLVDSQAECILNGAYLVAGRQHVDYHTQIEHLAPGCNSRQIYKGVIHGRGRAVFNGKVIIHSQAQQSSANQLNKNLLLGEKAEVDTKPELQIYADDVKCSHGATVGQLDEQALFYLQSRGVCKKDAQNWLVNGFVSEVLKLIDNPVLREFIQLTVIAHLNQLAGGDVKSLQELISTGEGVMPCH